MPMPRCAWLIVGMFLSACGSPPKPSLAETEKYPIAPGMHRYMVLPVGGPGVPSGVLRATIFNDSLQRETSVNVVNPWGANRDHPDELTLDHDGIGTFDVPIATHTYRFTIMDVRGQEVWTGPGLMLDERLESQLWYRIMDPKILATYMMDGRALCANAQRPVWWLSRADGRCYAADNPVPDTSIHLKNPEVLVPRGTRRMHRERELSDYRPQWRDSGPRCAEGVCRALADRERRFLLYRERSQSERQSMSETPGGPR